MEHQPGSVRRALVEATLLGVSVLAVYALGASRTIYVGDSGELVAAAATLGIPHPSGYPLYVLLGHLWIHLWPVGSVAFRMSLFSAACAAGAVGGLYLLGRSLAVSRVAALTGALLLAFSPSFWSQANVQRVYALNALLLVAMLVAAVRWRRTGLDRWLVLAVFVAALGACNHTFMAIAGLALGAWALVCDRTLLRRWRTLAAILGVGVLGLSPYLYLPLRSRMDPRLDWGNPETLQAFLDVVLRRGFWPRRWIEGPADLVPIAFDYLGSLGSELLFVGAGLAALGLWVARRRADRVWLLLVLVMVANAGSMALHGSRSDLFVWHRYYIPSYLAMALLAGLGVDALVERLPRRRSAARWAAAALPLLALLLRYPDFDRSRFRIAEDYSRSLLAGLPPGAHLAASDDNILFVLIYLRLVEGVRPDVNLIMQGVGGQRLPPLRIEPGRDRLFFTHHPNWDRPWIEIVPVGLVFEVRRPQPDATPPRITKWTLDGAEDPRVPKDHLTRNLIGEFHYMLGVTLSDQDWPRAAEQLRLAASSAPGNDTLHYNLGLVYWRLGLVAEAADSFARSAAVNPRHLASSQRVVPSERAAELLEERRRLAAIEDEIVRRDGGSLPPAGTAAWHLAVADRLAARGETLAARGHRLRALEAATNRS